MTEMDRRTFLKLSSGVMAGALVGQIKPDINTKINKFVTDTTGHPTGNAILKEKIEKDCQTNSNPLECSENYHFSIDDKINLTIIAPIKEEIELRALPSLVLSMADNKHKPLDDVLLGTGGLRMTRRELMLGFISSVVFGLRHNFTDQGFDTETIPASHMGGGMIYWYLQRKLGIAANITAHMMNNFKSLS